MLHVCGNLKVNPLLFMLMGRDCVSQIAGETKEVVDKPVPVPLCPPQIPHGLTWFQTQVCVVRGQWLIARAMAQPKVNPLV
jgi:hypothetical protein